MSRVLRCRGRREVMAAAQRSRFQQRRLSEREGGVCCKPELGGLSQLFAPVPLMLDVSHQ